MRKPGFSLMTIHNLSTLLSTEQVAVYLNIRPRTVLAWVQQGRLPKPIRIGKAPLWEESGLSIRVDEARIQRDTAITEPKKSAEKSRVKLGTGFTSSKELQLMVSLKRARLARSATLSMPSRGGGPAQPAYGLKKPEVA